MIADAIARGSAWLVVTLYVSSLILEVRQTRSSSCRVLWTLGALSLALHTTWTLMVVHHGNLREAYEHTAEKTQKLIGIPIGEGIYVNFAMLAIWLTDAAAWWLVPNWTLYRKRFLWLLHLAFSFLMLNAAIVFASPMGRLFGCAAFIVAVLAWLIPIENQPAASDLNQKH